jgi:two-component system sensor histidine kinase/response regulator
MPLDPSKVWQSIGWLVVLAAGAAAGLAGQRAARAAAVEALVDDLRRSTATFESAELDALQATEADRANPAYRAVKDRLIRLRAVEPNVSRLELVRQPGGAEVARLLADSTPADASGAALPGSALAMGEAESGWEAVLATGEPGVDHRLWPKGEALISAYVLVRDRGQGGDRDLLHAEVPLAGWDVALRGRAWGWAGTLWLGLGLPFGFFLLWRRRERAANAARGLARAVDLSHTPILLVDAAGRILHGNQGLCRQFGYTPEELVGRDWQVLGAPLESTAGSDLRATLDGGKAWQGSWMARGKDGSTWPVKGTASPVLDLAGSLQAFLLVLEDLTTARRHEDELAAARERAETSDRAKGHFLATLSHEVRTPLNGVVGFASLLLETPLTPEQREYAQTIRSSSEALIDLTSQVLDFSRLELGRVEPVVQPWVVADVVEDALEVFGSRSAEKQIELLHRIDPRVPAIIQTDGGRLRQILVNLISNAVKFTPLGEVEVLVTRPAPGGPLVFEVRDTGPGIAEADCSRIFLPFAQTEAALGHGGTGLGLAISRSLVEALGGEISARGEPGQGARFRFTLPAPAAEVVATADPRGLGGLRIAVCTRQAGLRAELTWLVESWGAAALPVPLPSWPDCDLALVDCDPDTMEVVNGLPTDDPTWLRDRVIGLVPFNLPAEARQVMRPRFVTLLNKPLRHQPLRRVVAGLLLPGGATDTHTPFSSLNLRVLVVEDNRVSQLLLQRMLDSLGCSWVTVPNGRRAVEELSVRDYDLVLMDLHMPELDGVAATRQVRSGEAGPVAREVWIAAVTADARREQRERAFAAGVNDYVEKPFTLADIEAALRRYRAERRSAPR